MRSVCLAISLLALAGCGPRPGPNNVECPKPIFAGRAVHEVWDTLVDAEDRTTVDHPRSPTIVDPTDGQSFSAGTLPAFRWSSPLRADAGRGAPDRRLARAEPRRSLWDTISGALIGSAWAHGAPVTGDVYALKFTIPGQECPVNVVTTDLEWIATAEAAELLRATNGDPSRVQITGAYVRDNRLEEGPYRRGTLTHFLIAR